MKTGLVMEGGAMRGMFTAGVIDTFMHEGITFDGAIGVSAGAAFGCNYKSHQIGRAIRYSTAYSHDLRYCSLLSWILTGDLYNGKFDYEVLPSKLDIWDADTFRKNPMEFWCVATNAKNGLPLYHPCTTGGKEDMLWIRGSASMPIASKAVQVDGYDLLDGGISDSVPLGFFQSEGYHKNVVILTQPESYRKKPFSERMKKVMKVMLRSYPAVYEQIVTRYERYNNEIAYIKRQEEIGNTFVIRPTESLNIGSICHDAKELERVYRLGVQVAREQMVDVKKFLFAKRSDT